MLYADSSGMNLNRSALASGTPHRTTDCHVPFRIMAVWLGALVAAVAPHHSTAATTQDARVTRIIRDVKLLPSGAKPQPATVNDEVTANTAVKTGDRSRSELTFADLTIERLGANTLFHFNNGGRVVELDGGSMLLRVPKDSGGAQMQTRAVTVGIAGTTLILETTSAGRNKLILLEGKARLALRKNPRESVELRGGQMEDVPAGATKLPPPVDIDVNDVMQHHPLITDFAPLPSRDLIAATIQNQPVTGQPVNGGPRFIPPVIGTLVSGGVPGRTGQSARPGDSGRRSERMPRDQTTTHRSGTNTGRKSSAGSSANTTGKTKVPSSTPAPSPARKRRVP
jgi:hypothetical protein